MLRLPLHLATGKRTRLARASAFAVLFGLLLGWIVTLPNLWLLELKGFDLLTLLTAPRKSTLPIVIVGIDDASLAEIRQRWPWPRALHAKLIGALKDAGAAAIAFDVIFDYPTETADDEAMARAVRYAGNVVLAAGMVKQETAHGKVWLRKDPLPAFREAGAATGLVNLQFDRDQGMRRIPDGSDVFWRGIMATLQRTLPEAVGHAAWQPESMIRFAGPSGTFQRISFYQALDPARHLGKDELVDALVIVGRETRSAADIGMAQADTFVTPFATFGGDMMPGAEIHANVVENILTGNSIRQVPEFLRLAFSTGIIFLLAWAMGSFRPLLSALHCLLAALGAALAAYLLFARTPWWLPVAHTLIGITALYFTEALLAYVGERRQRLAVKRVFARYVPEAIVNQLAAHPERLTLGGENREITLIFTDLAGFTTLSEQLQPTQAAELLNRYLTAMNKVIFQHGGTIDKFIGDGIMAFWNAPLHDPDHARHAVEAAIEMQQAMQSLNAGLVADGLPPLRMRIGVHTGVALVGNMGSDVGRLNYTAIGDVVNIASRLEGANKFYHTGILISQACASQIVPAAGLRMVDRVTVKGKTTAVEVLTPGEDAELATLNDQAIEAFRCRDFAASAQLWNDVLARAPDDPIARIYADRCTRYAETPPAEDWDASFVLESK